MGKETASPRNACDDNVVLFKRASLTAPSFTHFALSWSLFPLPFLCSHPSLSVTSVSWKYSAAEGKRERERGEQCHCSRSIRTFTNFIPAKIEA
ncbi:hypothetical protein MUK42_37722 [Musa troglodytarum]|uniref:Uncharacterized protein n=1 Tax=Musa troglodytarum TaxID=320322 RepID=A0A9E7FP31_9LILI|nr:hypothetical protein MUK42_37722 [Musa troglodytarum]